MMKQVTIAAVLLMALSSCMPGAAGNQGQPGVSAPVVQPPAPNPVQDDIDAMLRAENDYRQGLGQTQLSAGLSCTLYVISGGDRIQSSISGHNTLTGLQAVGGFLYRGSFDQPDTPISEGMNVLPSALRNIYKNMYLLRCAGQIVVLETNYYNFALNSDDASVLYVDGAKIIDNDNNHGTTLVAGQKYLRRGVHTIRLDYAQTGGGNQSLQLTSNGWSINPILYFH